MAVGKLSKERITVLVAANVDDIEKLLLFSIGKFKTPRCFKTIKQKPLEYEHNGKACMTTDLFSSWVKRYDAKTVRQHRKVLLFIDNCCAHPQIHSLRAVTHLFLSLNTTAVIQPCDVGIIKNLKHYYQKMSMRSMLTWYDSGKDMNGVPDYFTRCYGHGERSLGRQSVCCNDSQLFPPLASFNLRLLFEQMKKQQKLKCPKTSGVCESCMSWIRISMLAMWWRSARS